MNTTDTTSAYEKLTGKSTPADLDMVAEEVACLLGCLDAALFSKMVDGVDEVEETSEEWFRAWGLLVSLCKGEKGACRAISFFVPETDVIVWKKRSGWVSSRRWILKGGEAVRA